MLAVTDLEVAYGDLQVVWGVSFEVPERSIVAIIGPNGAGKTTTLRAIMSLLPVRGGRITFRERDITGTRTHVIVEQGVAMIPEARATFASMTVAQNLELGAYASRARGRRDETLAEVLETFPRLAERRRQLAGTLSGGERQMLAIGKALMARPDLLILDEPSLGLAPVIVESTFETIRAIRERGVSVLMVEQLVEQTLELADHAYILEMGRIVGDGPAHELMSDSRIRDAYLSL
jgi:branched-chain amino acid transport system ATP-binding protein